MTTHTVTELVRNGNRVGPRNEIGELVELARYTVAGAGERIVFGQRVNGIVRLMDRPARPGGRAYLIERELEQDGNAALKALLVDYLLQAEKLGQVPMAENVLGRYLEHLS